ncbi:hydrolase, NUDIX family protein [Pseudooceanicola batsensis HTCC2597]|uniref:Hydrolase, NUDIX family protein n=1 Tax=Pseudooceanicola batsensis (strain ATCC BAA-863 / DSM 15984 / KCTC 12145 / HTCC2597) TaxID=252305 RepID=A3U0J1_PSEBH|nr:NUDIX hydrolase [Pseudooceanicola batsensis]EAQ02282.1 hydrolase, NUDIX family protein [Pseudooceanicola batsensis HTCC2597]
MLKLFWSDYIQPLLRRPSRYQVAALCYRWDHDELQVLLITSLDTRRWILPKGWPKTGFNAKGVALEEAWEEAGVKPRGDEPRHVGRYRYDKRLRGGIPVPTDVDVYAIDTMSLYDDYPEAGRRDRRWMPPQEAAEAVDEPELKDLLAGIDAVLTGASR